MMKILGEIRESRDTPRYNKGNLWQAHSQYKFKWKHHFTLVRMPTLKNKYGNKLIIGKNAEISECLSSINRKIMFIHCGKFSSRGNVFFSCKFAYLFDMYSCT